MKILGPADPAHLGAIALRLAQREEPEGVVALRGGRVLLLAPGDAAGALQCLLTLRGGEGADSIEQSLARILWDTRGAPCQ